MELIDKTAIVAWAKETYIYENASEIRKVCFKQLLEYLDSIEIKKEFWDSEKVTSFIKENVREYHKSGVFHVDDFIKDLRKSMKD